MFKTSCYLITRVKSILVNASVISRRFALNSCFSLSTMAEALSKTDPHSFSNPDQCVVTDLNLNLNVDFSKQTLSGYVDLTVDRLDPKADHVLFDTKNLTIHNVRKKSTMSKMTYTLSPHIDKFGSKLEVKLPKTNTKVFNIRIDYETSPEATALQWLESSQTAGKLHPYMFSQCQAIHARTVLPCQDTPYVKSTYSATISAPAALTVLMSAVREGEEISDDGKKIYKFIQKVPIPVYLLAIAVGALESRKIGPRSHVWSEKEFIDRAEYEFAETETMLKIAEDICGPYVWGIYDLLVLPPSFAYGGMENPCITFVTPTLLCGDRSLTDVIAHEISHSWTGNLVTNKTFEHFWLNEGFTMFIERKILGRMYNEAHRQFSAIGGLKDLEDDVILLGEEKPLTQLVADLRGLDPDDSYCLVPYEKGHTFLFYLENILGGPEVFDKFLRAYLEKFKFKSLDSEEWKAYMYEFFHDKKDILDTVDWNAWLFSPGMPPVIPNYDKSECEKCEKLCRAWIEAKVDNLSEFTSKDIEDMNSLQIGEFFALLVKEAPIAKEKLDKMNELYTMENFKNSEIRFRWARLGLLSQWEPIIPHAIKFLTEQGRMKYVRPLYRDLYRWEEKRDLAFSTYKKHSLEMMYVAAFTVARDLNIKK